MLPQTTVPDGLINKKKRWLRKIINYILITCIALLPLQIQVLDQKPQVDIIIDNSVSMQSEDQSPTRLVIAEEMVSQINNFSNILTCFSMRQGIAPSVCKNNISLESSWSSLSDALLLSLNSQQGKLNTKIVLTDGGINTWIELSQVINNSNENQIIRIDILASTGNVIINWVTVGQQIQLQKLPKMTHYMLVSDYSQIPKIIKDVKKAVIAQHWSIDLNKIFLTFALILFLYIVNQSLKIKNQKDY